MTFRPPWWCRHRHAQTLWGPLFRRVSPGALRRERFATSDGDFVDIDFVDIDWDGSGGDRRLPAGAPLLLVLHGLEGSSRSHYVAGLLGEARARRWRAAALNFRSCSGEPNRLPRFYHSGETGDLDEVMRSLVAREPDVRVVAAGISLGGNVLLKWLGEQGQATPPQLIATAAISVPFNLAACARVLDRGFNRRVYTANFMRTLRAKVRVKATAHPGFVDVAAALRARTFVEYDRVVTAPLGGFTDEVDYWTRASSGPYLARIGRPTLLINALDDPFVPPNALPSLSALPPHVRAEFTPRGGHAGFLEGRWPWAMRSWAERRAVGFLAEVLGAVE